MSREWDGSGVMSEFLKIAAESGLISPDLKQEDGVGNPTKDTPVKGCTRNEPTKEYGVKTEPKDIVDKAHPQEAWMADKSTPVHSMGNGSLVENIKEQQEKDIEIATKVPPGALFGIHADLINRLVKLANTLEEEGKVKEAARVDEAIKKISAFPFDKGHLHKEAGWFLIPLLLAGGYAGAKMFGAMLTSKQENLRTDIVDLYDILLENKNKSKSIEAAAELLEPFISKFNAMDLSSQEGSNEYSNLVRSFGPVLRKVGMLIRNAKEDIKEKPESGVLDWLKGRWKDIKGFFGFEDYKLIAAKYTSALKSYTAAQKYVHDAKKIETNVLGPIGGVEKAITIKDILDRGFMGKKYTNLEDLEIALNQSLQKLYMMGKIKKSMVANIVQNGKLTGTPQKVKEVLEIVEKKILG